MSAAMPVMLPGMAVEVKVQESDEWYTPSMYVEAARRVMGGIDLDPASCAYAQQTVRAATYYTAASDGLARPWQGRVWLNPPYSAIAPWSSKLLAEYAAGNVTAAIMLIPANVETGYFQQLFGWPMCFVSYRIRFENPYKAGDNPRYNNVFIHLPSVTSQEPFYEVFSQFGRVGRLSTF